MSSAAAKQKVFAWDVTFRGKCLLEGLGSHYEDLWQGGAVHNE
jgi:hypothetical protein